MPWPANAASPWTSRGKYFSLPCSPCAILFGASTAHGHGVHRFQMAGIRNQVDVNFRPRAGHVFAGCAHVVFHVAAAQNAARIHVFKSGKDFFGRTPGHVHNHVQPAAVAHAHHQIHRAALTGCFENFIHQGDQGGHAFERKALVAEIALLQDLLEQVGPDELVENVLLIHRRLGTFHTLLDPAALYRVGDVKELGADGSAINPAGLVGKFAFQPKVGMGDGRQKAERVEIGFQISPEAERVKNAFTVAVGSFENSGSGSFTSSLSSGGHRSTTRIADEAICVLDSALRRQPGRQPGGIPVRTSRPEPELSAKPSLTNHLAG